MVPILTAFSDNQPQQAEYDCIAQMAQNLGVTPARLKERSRRRLS